jgi:hypothetical protein
MTSLSPFQFQKLFTLGVVTHADRCEEVLRSAATRGFKCTNVDSVLTSISAEMKTAVCETLRQRVLEVEHKWSAEHGPGGCDLVSTESIRLCFKN